MVAAIGTFEAALWAMAATTGLLLIVAGERGLLPRFERKTKRGPNDTSSDHMTLRVVLGAAGFVLAFALTRWPVAALYCGIGGLCLPTLALARRRRREAVERVEAIAAWAESLRDTMAASAGIQEALRASARVAPAPIQTEVRDLALRLQHQSVSRSLRRFAADMAHPLSDMIVASLLLATSRHAGSLQPVLAQTAKAARDSAAMSRQVESRRARTYSQARLAAWISALMVLFLVLARRAFLAPYDTVGGQIALIVICGVFFLSGLSLYLLARPVQPRRLFSGIENWTDVGPGRLARTGPGERR